MRKPSPDIMAVVHLLPTEYGGRSVPTPSDRFGCLFDYKGEYFESILLLYDIGSIGPGAEKEVPILFLSPEVIKHRLKAGDVFRLWEGRTIAHGRVTKLLENAAESTDAK